MFYLGSVRISVVSLAVMMVMLAPTAGSVWSDNREIDEHWLILCDSKGSNQGAKDDPRLSAAY